MTEQEWLECTDPTPMLEFLRGRVSDRKLRLFAVAAFHCRKGFDEQAPENSDALTEARQVILVAELYADGGLPETAIEEARTRLFFQWLLKPQAWLVATQSSMATVNLSSRQNEPLAVGIMEGHLASLVQDIFGNPFRPVPINSVWLTPTVSDLARAAYEERIMPSGELDPSRLAILSDALEECGCDDVEILDHLRSSGPHVRGCWAVDLLLGKE